MSAVADTSETLQWERTNRGRAGVAAIAAGALTLLGNIIPSIALSGLPKADGPTMVTVTEALGDAVAGRPIPPGRLSVQTAYLGHHATGSIIGAILLALGTLLLFVPMAYLFRAVKARTERVGQWLLVLLAAGAVLNGVGLLLTSLARDFGAMSFVDGADRSNSAAAAALTQSPSLAGQIMSQAGALALGFGVVITCLNAMRVGLLTRFMGILGMIVGAFFVLPFDQLGIVRSFWLAALGMLILGRWPTGMPKAWETGEAAAWPTQQEVRERRAAARGEPVAASAGGRGGRAARGANAPASRPARAETTVPTAPRPEPRTSEAHASSKKKRRKRRS